MRYLLPEDPTRPPMPKMDTVMDHRNRRLSWWMGYPYRSSHVSLMKALTC